MIALSRLLRGAVAICDVNRAPLAAAVARR